MYLHLEWLIIYLMSHKTFILKRHFSPNFGCCCVWVSFSFSVAISSENVICAERLEDSCCSGWFGALSPKTILFIFMYGIAPVGSTAEPLVSDANRCLEPSESAVLRWYEWEDAGEQRLLSLIGKVKDCREVGNRDRKRGATYIELNLCKISSAVLQDAVGWGHRKKFPLAVIQKCLLVLCNVFCAPQEGQVYIFHWKLHKQLISHRKSHRRQPTFLIPNSNPSFLFLLPYGQSYWDGVQYTILN